MYGHLLLSKFIFHKTELFALKDSYMEKKNDLLTAIEEIKKCLEGQADQDIIRAFVALEGIMPFLEKRTIINIKCKGCDNYALSSFPALEDLCKVDSSDYCHANRHPLERLGTLQVASCTEYSQKAQKDLEKLANLILNEDIKPAFEYRKLYNKKRFASYEASFRINQKPGNICIEFGYVSDGTFTPSDLQLYLIRRLDPEFGPAASQKIAGILKCKPILFISANKQTRWQMDIDYILEWIAKKRKMDIVYL